MEAGSSLVDEPAADRVMVDRQREAAMDGEDRPAALAQRLLAAAALVAGEQEQAPAREPAEGAQAAQGGAGEEEGGLAQALPVLAEDAVELGIAVGRAADPATAVGDLHLFEQRRVVEV